MRISDWSSDVCSSDLESISSPKCDWGFSGRAVSANRPRESASRAAARDSVIGSLLRSCQGGGPARGEGKTSQVPRVPARRRRASPERAARRSEEHTSELQSLMRLSYSVFCLKKKNNTTKN